MDLEVTARPGDNELTLKLATERERLVNLCFTQRSREALAAVGALFGVNTCFKQGDYVAPSVCQKTKSQK